MNVNLIGTKAANLLRLKDQFGFDVPAFEIATFADSIENWPHLRGELNRLVADHLTGNATLERTTDQLSLLLETAKPTDTVIARLVASTQLQGSPAVSYRTSAATEDGRQTSFAGLYETYLDQPLNPEAIRSNLLNCLASLVSPRVLSYAKLHGLTDFRVDGSVVVQRMFYGSHSGVLFTEVGTGSLLLASNQHWLNSVVGGEDATELRLDRAKLANGGYRGQVEHQVLRLCEIALTLERAEGCPIDLEWAYDDQRVCVLQYRPQTTAFLEQSFEWDSTNISENYPGLTLPLTYSVIRRLYAGVYGEFFRLLGASELDVRRQQPLLDNMLGYVNGRVYYRITSWYRAVALLPGRRNQQYFEAMLNPVRKQAGQKKAGLDARSVTAALRFVWLLSRSQRLSTRFAAGIKTKIDYYRSLQFEYLTAPTIVDNSKAIRTEMLADWAIPILNDVKLMVFHGALRRLFAGTPDPNAYLALIQGLSDRASVRPLAALTELGLRVQQAIDHHSYESVEQLAGSPSWPAIEQAAREYAQTFGARTPGELKLENQRLADDPVAIIDLALKAANSGITADAVATVKSNANRALPWHKRRFAKWLAHNTKLAIDWRERFRFNRAQTFDLSRRAFDALGAILTTEGVIEQPRDIYWLTEQEVDDLVNAHAPETRAIDRVASRKATFTAYQEHDLGLGVTGHGRLPVLRPEAVPPTRTSETTAGNGVAPGVVTAPVLVMTQFDGTADVRGKILVVELIDPGWTLLFTQAAGVITERGNALSHAAIISREIGIPAIVGLRNATDTFTTGQILSMNGTTGEVHLES